MAGSYLGTALEVLPTLVIYRGAARQYRVSKSTKDHKFIAKPRSVLVYKPKTYAIETNENHAHHCISKAESMAGRNP